MTTPPQARRTVIETFTPHRAAEALATMIRNRTVRKRNVDMFANDMRNGRWIDNGQGITFDLNGHLIDGQHRMLAIIEAGATIELQVTYGVDREKAMPTIDRGGVRNYADITNLRGEKVRATAVQAAARSWRHYEELGLAWKHDVFSLSPSEIDSYRALHPMIDEASRRIEALPVVRKFMLAGQATWAYAQIAELYGEDVAELFFQELNNGVAPSEHCPVTALRKRMIENVTNIKRPNGRDMCAHFVKTFRRWSGEDKRVKVLTVLAVEDFPLFGADRRLLGRTGASSLSNAKARARRARNTARTTPDISPNPTKVTA